MSDVSWDAQAECEHAMLTKANLVVLLLDYRKFFDAFEPEWVRKFAIALGLDTDLAESAAQLYKNLIRFIKIGNTYGDPLTATNGLGQGDSYSLLIALSFISIQFHFLTNKHPNIKMGSCLDDRNIRGVLDDVYNAYKDIIEIDTAAGHYVNPKKLAMTATTIQGRQSLKNLNMGTEAEPVAPRIFLSEKVVGDMICTKKAPARASSDARMKYAINAAQRVEVLQCQRAQKARAVATTVIP